MLHADLSAIATFHCNDMVVDSVGRAYVGNFGFDLDTNEINGTLADVLATHDGATLARVDPDGSIHAAADGLMFPNGTVITPDGRDVDRRRELRRPPHRVRHRRRRLAVEPAGVGRPRQPHCPTASASMPTARSGSPTPWRNECFRVAEGGEILDVIETDNRCFACMLGGPDRRTLFMLTSQHSLAVEAAVHRTGNILIADVDYPGAGLP